MVDELAFWRHDELLIMLQMNNLTRQIKEKQITCAFQTFHVKYDMARVRKLLIAFNHSSYN